MSYYQKPLVPTASRGYHELLSLDLVFNDYCQLFLSPMDQDYAAEYCISYFILYRIHHILLYGASIKEINSINGKIVEALDCSSLVVSLKKIMFWILCM